MFRFSLLVALLVGLTAFTSCERHHPGEFPELQEEHTQPLQNAATQQKAVEPTTPTPATPANFFPNKKP